MGNPFKGFEHSFTVGCDQSSPKFWGYALALCLKRIEAGQRAMLPFEIESFDETRADDMLASSFQQAADVHFTLVAIRNILRIMEDRLATSEDPRLVTPAREFRESFPDAWTLRDILEHLLDYNAGRGKLQKSGEMPTDENIPNLIYGSTTDPTAEIVLLFNFKARNIRIKDAARKAIQIAALLHQLEGEANRA